MKKKFIIGLSLSMFLICVAIPANAASGILIGTGLKSIDALNLGYFPTIKAQYVRQQIDNVEFGIGIETSVGAKEFNNGTAWSLTDDNGTTYISKVSYFALFCKARQYFDGNKLKKNSFFGEINGSIDILKDDTNSGFQGTEIGLAAGYSVVLGNNWVLEPQLNISWINIGEGIARGTMKKLSTGSSGFNVGISVDSTINF
jgi:hypothetical protein